MQKSLMIVVVKGLCVCVCVCVCALIEKCKNNLRASGISSKDAHPSFIQKLHFRVLLARDINRSLRLALTSFAYNTTTHSNNPTSGFSVTFH